jgi:apolipoprotein N-acyltransferase
MSLATHFEQPARKLSVVWIVRFVLCLLSGLAIVAIKLGFSSYFIFVALLPFIHALCSETRPMRLPLLFMTFQIPVVYTVFQGISDLDSLTRLDIALLYLVAVLEYGCLGLLAAVVKKRLAITPFLLLLPIVWGAFETVFGSFYLLKNFASPFLLGYWTVGTPFALVGRLSGVIGVSIFVVAVNVFLYLVFFKRRFIAGGVLLIFLSVAFFSSAQFKPSFNKEIRVGFIQAGYTHAQRYEAFSDEQVRKEHFETYTSLTQNALKEGADLIIWPEVAVPGKMYYKIDEPLLQNALQGAKAAIVGSVYQKVFDTYNAALLFNNGELQGTYFKRALVPKGETSWLTSGSTTGYLNVDGAKIGILVCMDQLYPELARETVRNGAETLVVLVHADTNAGIPMHHRVAQFRAIETGRYVTFASELGMSAVVSPDGSINMQTLWQSPIALLASLSFIDSSSRTPFLRWGNWMGNVSLLCTIAFLVTRLTVRKGYWRDL